MGLSRCLLVVRLLAFLCAHLVTLQAVDAAGEGTSLQSTIDCNSACAGRCRLASRYKICIRACGTCCHRCKCVPPGTSGNREACGPCYANMPTHGGRLKCP